MDFADFFTVLFQRSPLLETKLNLKDINSPEMAGLYEACYSQGNNSTFECVIFYDLSKGQSIPMKNYLLVCLAVFTLSSCDVFRFYDFKINNAKEYHVKTDCGALQITSVVTDFITYREVRIEFVADSLKKRYTILPEKFRLYANAKQIPLKKAYSDHRKTHFAIDGRFKDSIGSGIKIFVLADGAILCNGESVIKKDTLHFEIIPR